MGTTYLPQTAATWLGPATARSSEQQRGIEIAVALSRAGLPFGLDRWDGYPAARERLLRGALAAGANLVALSGDSHNGWAYEFSVDGAPAEVEFAGQAVSSLGLEKRFNGDPARIAADFIAANTGLKWCDTSRRGYMIVEFARDHARAQMGLSAVARSALRRAVRQRILGQRTWLRQANLKSPIRLHLAHA